MLSRSPRWTLSGGRCSGMGRTLYGPVFASGTPCHSVSLSPRVAASIIARIAARIGSRRQGQAEITVARPDESPSSTCWATCSRLGGSEVLVRQPLAEPWRRPPEPKVPGSNPGGDVSSSHGKSLIPSPLTRGCAIPNSSALTPARTTLLVLLLELSEASEKPEFVTAVLATDMCD